MYHCECESVTPQWNDVYHFHWPSLSSMEGIYWAITWTITEYYDTSFKKPNIHWNILHWMFCTVKLQHFCTSTNQTSKNNIVFTSTHHFYFLTSLLSQNRSCFWLEPYSQKPACWAEQCPTASTFTSRAASVSVSERREANSLTSLLPGVDTMRAVMRVASHLGWLQTVLLQPVAVPSTPQWTEQFKE